VSNYISTGLITIAKRPTVCVTGAGAGVDKIREQEKLEARKMLQNGDESHLSCARFVRRFSLCKTRSLKKYDTTDMTTFSIYLNFFDNYQKLA
jgi:hypothetical protein